MSKKHKKKNKIEKFIYKSFIVTTIVLIVGIIFSKAMLSQINLEVQKLNNTIEGQKESNKSLVMKINEMVSLERIQEVSSEMGLTYNNENIKTITE